MGAWGRWNLDASRHQRELIPPLDFFRLSYYERWTVALLELMLQRQLVTSAELASGKPDPAAAVKTPPLTAEGARLLVARGVSARRDAPATPRFRAGQPVRARNLNPAGHTRLPRYVRGRLGTIHQDHGVFVFPDTNARFAGEHPQHVYAVRFGARELWGEQAGERDAVYVDLWDDYLDPA